MSTNTLPQGLDAIPFRKLSTFKAKKIFLSQILTGVNNILLSMSHFFSCYYVTLILSNCPKLKPPFCSCWKLLSI